MTHDGPFIDQSVFLDCQNQTAGIDLGGIALSGTAEDFLIALYKDLFGMRKKRTDSFRQGKSCRVFFNIDMGKLFIE
jgi:hypothetical protein